MRQTLLLITASFVLAACVHNSNDSQVATMAVDGEAAYVEHCAGCHETGMLGAPREGQSQDWEGRSSLWQGVLMEHAKTGFFDMPARGGKSELPDDIVSAAAEYMLESTFPNRPED